MNQIIRLPSNVDHYYGRMANSLKDKLFFLERIPSDVSVFADFGCGDGRLLDQIAFERKGTSYLIGYDRSADALALASERNPDAFWTPAFALLCAKLDAHHKEGRKSCLVLSSVVHEVLSTDTCWSAFWAAIRSLGCDYIAIRDMACLTEASTTAVSLREQRALVCNPAMRDVLLYGVKEPGYLSSRAEMLQALLKYRYTDDLQKELDENYFPLTVEQWLNLTTVGSGYNLRHFDHYSIPYLRAQWFSDFGVEVPDATHIKILLKKA